MPSCFSWSWKVHSQTDMFVVGMQQEVVEALGQRIENS